MKIRNPLLIRWLAFAFACAVRLWLSTLYYKIVFPEGYTSLVGPRQQRFIVALWHESILAGLVVRTQVRALISQHADGEFIAQVGQFLGYGSTRGSTTRGGAEALQELTELGDAHLLVTPDGPRGPRRTFQPGTVYLASRTGLPLILIGVGFSHAWRANSWDRFAVPLPFSTVYNVVSELIWVPGDLSKSARGWWRIRLEDYFVRLTAIAERWALGGPRPTSEGRKMLYDETKCAA